MKKLFLKLLIIEVVFIFLFSYISTFADDLDNSTDLLDVSKELNALNYVETSSSGSSTLNLNTRSCIVLDRLSKKILYGKNEYNKVKMASTTKIMTATIIIENCNLEETVEVSKKAANTGGSRLGLKTGDKITIKDLLYGLMLRSGNDAAVALAEVCAGSIVDFSNLMNKKANELGLVNTHFESPHGLDSDGHYTTAYELALLSDYALKNKTFLQIVGTYNYTISINGHPKSLTNTNELLGNLNGVYGIKTGFTNGANRCLVTACKRNDMDIICVVLGCDTKKFRTSDSIKLIEYTFSNFEYVNIQEKIDTELENWKKENENYFFINKGISSDLIIKYSELDTPIIPINKNEISSIDVNIYIDSILESPIHINDTIGKIKVTSNNNSILSCNIL
ncbi:MAG: D-alanyl-D-alanine carboxypeptidase, partial [Clostridia bacterium]|nr:D-alanyl-D-alanine carboxypeptidase [Clostridia bacterium]